MGKYLLQNTTVITFSPLTIERIDVRIAEGKILAKGKNLEIQPDETFIDLSGKILMPGMVCAHTHFYSALARGMPAPPKSPHNFPEILEYVWWRLDRALNQESLYYSTIIGVLEALQSGTTTIIDHNASPGYVRGSLKIMKRVFEELGVRSALCYETTDRNGLDERDQGIEENRWLLEHQSDLVKGLVGAHAAFTLSDESLRVCAELIQTYDSGIHIHLAEDVCDITISKEKYHKGLVERLYDLNVLNAKSIVAHGVHLDEDELNRIADIGCWLVHNPRSNMNNSVGYFTVSDALPVLPKLALGTDGIGANMFEEAKFAFFKAQDSGKPIGAEVCTYMLAGGQRLASEIFGLPIGTLESGAAADLIVLDYPLPTPLHEGNLPWHLIFGMTHAHVESVMVNGKWLIRNRQFVNVDIKELYQKAQTAAEKLWQRMENL